jgi:hypothetical protein
VLDFVRIDGQHSALPEEGVHEVAFTVVKTVHREVHRSALNAKLLRLELEAFLDNVVREVPDLLALVIEAQREDARLVYEDDVDERVRYVVYWYDALLEADHLRNVQFLEYVRLVEHRDLEHFVFNVRDRVEVANPILLHALCFDVVAGERERAADLEAVRTVHDDGELLLGFLHHSYDSSGIIGEHASYEIHRRFNDVLFNQVFYDVLVWAKSLNNLWILVTKSKIIVFNVHLFYNALAHLIRQQLAMAEHVFRLLYIFIVITHDLIVKRLGINAIILQ